MARFIHERAFVDRDVSLGDGCTVWPFASIRSDEGHIEIGRNVSVQEHCAVHGTGVRVGDNVTVGHGAVLHGCSIGSNVLVGIGAIVLSGARVGDWCIIGAGAVVTEGASVPEGSLVLGVPGKVARQLTDADRARITESWRNYAEKLKKLARG